MAKAQVNFDSLGGGGVEIDFTKVVFDNASHGGSSFTISVPSKPILISYDYTYGGQTYAYVCDSENRLEMASLTVSSNTYVQGYDESTQLLTLSTASTGSLAYKIAVFY